MHFDKPVKLTKINYEFFDSVLQASHSTVDVESLYNRLLLDANKVPVYHKIEYVLRSYELWESPVEQYYVGALLVCVRDRVIRGGNIDSPWACLYSMLYGIIKLDAGEFNHNVALMLIDDIIESFNSLSANVPDKTNFF